MSLSRPSWRAVAAVLSTGALVAAGAGTLSFATPGHSSPRASHTTTIKNTGHGPALSLISGKKYAPLKVSNAKVVKKLNADLLDGLDSTQIAPETTRVSLGSPGETFTTYRYLTFTLPAAIYEMSMAGQFSVDAGASWQCLVGDKVKLLANDSSGIYLFDAGTDTAIPSGVTTHQIVGGVEVLVGCYAAGAAATMGVPPTFDFHPVAGLNTVPATPLILRPGHKSVLEAATPR